jgi:hypothetical protein
VQVTTHEALSLDQLSSLNPGLAQGVREAMAKPTPGNRDMVRVTAVSVYWRGHYDKATAGIRPGNLLMVVCSSETLLDRILNVTEGL